MSPEDLRMLDSYRLSFALAYEAVLQQVRASYGPAVSGRPAKSTTAIVEKLKRESIRLSQMQDIAGCRVVVSDIAHQNMLTQKLSTSFSRTMIFDRRKNPSHGYRAVHFVVQIESRHVEVQIRTQLQHLWAELSEKLADKFGIAVKYGGGVEAIRQQLRSLSEAIDFIELVEPAVTDHVTLSLLEDFKTKIRVSLNSLLNAVEAENDFPD
jgi:putative GTP pyrophosphokinase